MKKPYSLKNNFLYAMDGAKEVIKERAFQIELFAFFIGIILLFVFLILYGLNFLCLHLCLCL